MSRSYCITLKRNCAVRLKLVWIPVGPQPTLHCFKMSKRLNTEIWLHNDAVAKYVKNEASLGILYNNIATSKSAIKYRIMRCHAINPSRTYNKVILPQGINCITSPRTILECTTIWPSMKPESHHIQPPNLKRGKKSWSNCQQCFAEVSVTVEN